MLTSKVEEEEFYTWEAKAFKKEIQKLDRARFVSEVIYLKWFVNIILVNKVNWKWRVCVNFTNLNKAYPKDSYSLLRIDQFVNSTQGHGLLSFLDTYSGYLQISMVDEDMEKTSFIINKEPIVIM